MTNRITLLLVLSCLQSLASAQFSPPKTIAREALGQPTCMAQGDLDGDGDVDLLAAGYSGGLALFINTDGLGAFETIVMTDAPEYFDALHLVDVDVDGLVDVVVEDQTIEWARNTGGNSFAPLIPFPNTSQVHSHICFDDADGDGDLDAYMAADDLLIRMENLGGGQFGTAELIDSFPFANVERILTLDHDGDGDRDIAVDLDSSNEELRLYRHEVDGSFIQQEVIVIPYCGSLSFLTPRVRAFDHDGDGLDDLIIAADCEGGIEWLRSLGEDGFASAQPMATFSAFINMLDCIDVDNDGVKDLLAMTQDGLELARGLGAGTYSAPINVIDYPESSSPIHFIMADIDGDGNPEIFTTVSRFNRVLQYDVPGDGTFRFNKVLTDHVRTSIYDDMRVADINGDDLLDVLLTTNNEGYVVTYMNLGSEGFSVPNVVVRSDALLKQMEVVDMNDDGMVDVVLYDDSLHIYLNQGDGAFEQIIAFLPALTYQPHDFYIADLDGDTDMDLLVNQQNDIRRLRNNGNNTFTILPILTALTSATSWPVLTGFLDVDEDGDLDLMSWGVWARNNGQLAFSTPTSYGFTGSSDFMQIVDMDGDGREDLFYANTPVSDPPIAYWVRRSGPGVFEPALEIATFNDHDDRQPRPLDVDNDGDMDVVIALPEGAVFVENLGDDGFGPEQPLSTVPWNAALTNHDHAYDIDADGDQDYLFVDGLGLADEQYDRNGLVWVENFGADPYELNGSVFADMDGDGLRGMDEPSLPGTVLVSVPDGYIALNDATGAFTIHCQSGERTVSANAPSTLWALSTTPDSYTVEATEAQPTISGLDFGFLPSQDVSLVTPAIVLSVGVCSDTTSLWISMINDGTRVEQGMLSLTLDQGFSFVTSEPSPLSVVGNEITWEFDSLTFGEMAVFHTVVVMPGAGLMGVPYMHSAVVTTVDGVGVMTGAFDTTDEGVLLCSYDPNDKQVSPTGYGIFGSVPLDQQRMEYTVRFQNTGNAPAIDLMIRDQLSPSLDLTRVEFLGASHQPTSISISTSGELVARFDGIQLPDSGTSFTDSQGFIRFTVALLPGQPHLSQVRNTAEIYFDLNEEVVTNTVRNTLVDCSLWLPQISLVGDMVLEVTEGEAYQWFLDGEPIEGATDRTLMMTDNGAYTSEVRSVYGCNAVSDPLISTGLDALVTAGFHAAVVPNPFSNDARLLLSEPVDLRDRIEIVDALGRVVRTLATRGTVVLIDREGLTSGLYLVRVLREKTILITVRMLVE